MARLFTDNAAAKLSSPIGAADTSITLDNASKFPSPTGGDFFDLTLTQSGTETSWEIVKVTARTGNVLTVVRAQQGTVAAVWAVDSKAELRVTAEVLKGFVPSDEKGAANGVAPLDANGRVPAANMTTTNLSLTTPTVTGTREVRVAMPASNIDLLTGNYFTKTISASTTLTVSNVPASGIAASFILELTNGGAFGVTWWTGVKWANGAVPSLTISGRDVLGFFTHNGGSIWTGVVLGKDVK